MLVISLGHMTVDCYANVVPPILPLLRDTYGLSFTASGMIMAVFTVTSSIIQPVFGLYADRHGKRWMMAFSVLWAACFTSLLGAIEYLRLDASGVYGLTLLLVAVAGLGYAAYHPLASAAIPRISGQHKGLAMSVFSAGGNLGYALMPLIMVWMTMTWGIGSILVLVIPGLGVALLLRSYAPAIPQPAARVSFGEIFGSVRKVARPLALVTGVVCMRVWLFTGLITFLPLYYVLRHETPEAAAARLFILLGFGAAGTLLGGFASDKYGKKPVILLSMAATAPLLSLSLWSGGLASWTFTAAAGMVMLASFSPAVLLAQELVPKNKGLASSIILGFAFGLGGLGVALTGLLADTFGIGAGICSLILLPLAGFMLALLLPGKLAPERH